MVKLSIVFFVLTLAFVLPTYAHDEHEGGHHNHDHAALCKFISKMEADIPDLAKPNWQKVKTVASGFTYIF